MNHLRNSSASTAERQLMDTDEMIPLSDREHWSYNVSDFCLKAADLDDDEDEEICFVYDDGLPIDEPVDEPIVKPVKLYTLSPTSCLSILYALLLVARFAASYQPLVVVRPADLLSQLQAFPIG